jgi:hypothetical protein
MTWALLAIAWALLVLAFLAGFTLGEGHRQEKKGPKA